MPKEAGFFMKRGFSLIEMTVVVSIIAVLTVSGIAVFQNLSTPAVDSKARKIVSDIVWARELAVTTHQHHVIRFDLANKTYSIYSAPSGIFDSTAILLKKAFVEISMSLVQADLWIYSPKGNTSGTSNITLNSEGKTKNITIFPETGYVKIQ